jgi:hypothetical protein
MSKDLAELVEYFDDAYVHLNGTDQIAFIEHFVRNLEPNQLVHLSKRLDALKLDFIRLLPTEITDRILSYCDLRTLCECCKVRREGIRYFSSSTKKR